MLSRHTFSRNTHNIDVGVEYNLKITRKNFVIIVYITHYAKFYDIAMINSLSFITFDIV